MMTATVSLEATLQQIVQTGPGGGGYAVRHIERGEQFGFDAETPYPAASVFKVPVLVEAFRRFATGDLSPADRWELSQDEKSTGGGVLVRLQAGLQPTVRDLLTLMIIISDNTAADMLVRKLGPERITDTMRALGLQQTTVALTCRDLIRTITPAAAGLLPFEAARVGKEHPASPESVAYAGTQDNNVSTANEMVELFAKIHTGEGLDSLGISEAARAEMRSILLEQQLNDRLPRFLPGTVPVAHKTGSLGGAFLVRNDAGLIDLSERGTLAIAAFTRTPVDKEAGAEEASRLATAIDCQIAAFARAAYDYYTSPR